MPKIHVDEQVMTELKRRANGSTPNNIIRQLLGLWTEEPLAAQPGFYLVPHSPKEFPGGAGELSQWLSNDLARRPSGEYYVASSHYWRNVVPSSTCLFHKDKQIVGEGRLVGGLFPYRGTEVSPQTNKLYAGIVHFAPASIEVYDNPVTFDEAEGLLGKSLSFRAVQRITQTDYDTIRKAAR